MGQQAVKPRKIPTRQCLGCNEHKPKKELLRVLRTPEGEITLDFTGKKSGRGAYICYDMECLEKAQKSKRLEKALEIKIEDELYDQIKNVIENKNGGDVIG